MAKLTHAKNKSRSSDFLICLINLFAYSGSNGFPADQAPLPGPGIDPQDPGEVKNVSIRESIRDGSFPAFGVDSGPRKGGLIGRCTTEPGSRLSPNKRTNLSDKLY